MNSTADLWKIAVIKHGRLQAAHDWSPYGPWRSSHPLGLFIWPYYQHHFRKQPAAAIANVV
jgi:hypothetical protein